MKVFISHSSQDKWIARRLSHDLEALGATTFLDEKDIATGDSIDETIQKHLSECDEILMLLSPAALQSHWVLLEIGGAKALGMRLVPVLLHVDANDLPPPLAKGLARDLNDVEKYYKEVEQRVATTKKRRPRKTTSPATRTPTVASRATARAEAASVKRRTFKVGDLVKIPEQPQEPFVGDKGRVSWRPDMTAHVGRTATVTQVDTDRTVKLDIDGARWWAMDWLEPASGP